MITSIGRNLHHGRARVALAVGLLAVGVDLWLAWRPHSTQAIEGRWAVALVALASQLWLAGDLPSVGLSAPAGGWWLWVRRSCYLGLMVAVCLGAAAELWVAVGWRLPVVSVASADVGPAFFHMCVFATLFEEAIYRVALCVPLAATAGAGWAVAASGAVFGLLHVVYGNPSPENLFGGFFLAWAYLRSGSVCVPVLLHAAGNLLALAGQIVGWYYLGRG